MRSSTLLMMKYLLLLIILTGTSLKGFSAEQKSAQDTTGYIIKSKKPSYNGRATSLEIEVFVISKPAGLIQYGFLDKDGALLFTTWSGPDGKINCSIHRGSYSAIKILTMDFDTLVIPLAGLYGQDVKIDVQLKPTIFTDRTGQH